MTPRLALLFTTTALTVALGPPALAAMLSQGTAAHQCSGVCAAVFSDGASSLPLIRVSGDDDDDGGWLRRGRGNDDDDDCDGGDEGDDDCAGVGGRGNPAPAGTVAPPANGLFGSGAPPVAVTN